MRWWVLGLVVFWSLVLGYALYVKPRRHADPDLPSPVLASDEIESDGLELEISVERDGSSRRLELVSRSGAAILVLEDAEGDGFASFGDGRFEQRDRAAGKGFVADVARWLGRDEPPEPVAPGELAPFPVSYAFLGEEGGQEANKLFLEYGHRYAEVYLNLDAEGQCGLLLEKDEEYAADLLVLLALALRDGEPPRRTAAADANLATDAPLVAELSPLECEGEPSAAVWTARGALAVLGDRPARLVAWPAPETGPVPVATLDGVVHALVVSPDGARVALVLVQPQEGDHYSSEDGGELIVLDVASGWRRTLACIERALPLADAAFSPDGARLAYSVTDEEGVGHVRVCDSASGALLHGTSPEDDLTLDEWTDEGLLLYRGGWDDDGDWTPAYFRWTPGGEPRPVDPPVGYRSPGGRYEVVPAEDGVLRIRGPEGVGAFTSADEGDRAFIRDLHEYKPWWCGPGRLVLRGHDVLVLDLGTRRLRYLFPARTWTFVAADTAGRRVLARDATGRLHWGEIR